MPRRTPTLLWLVFPMLALALIGCEKESERGSGQKDRESPWTAWFTPRSEQAKITQAQTDIANIELALETFEVDCARYPTKEEGLGALVVMPANADNWRGPYLKKGLPRDPWGHPYVYRCPGQHNPDGFDLSSFGPDGQEGGGDDIDNWTGDSE